MQYPVRCPGVVFPGCEFVRKRGIKTAYLFEVRHVCLLWTLYFGFQNSLAQICPIFEAMSLSLLKKAMQASRTDETMLRL